MVEKLNQRNINLFLDIIIMGKKIYGVDVSKKVTPLMVRDAIIKCFISAHKEVLDNMKEYGSFKSRDEFERIKKLNVEYLIRALFSEDGKDFENPTKEDLIQVVSKLAEIAVQFRSPEIVKRHYNEIKQLIEKLE